MIKTSLFIDAHVHLYDCFDTEQFITAAYTNLSAVAGSSSNDKKARVLLLTETATEDGFERLRDAACTSTPFRVAGEDWHSELKEETQSILLQSASEKQLFIIAGRQNVCREGLEIHALATDKAFDDGQPLVEMIAEINDSGAVAAMPWGAGKWLGQRGKILNGMKQHLAQSGVLLSDSGVRPWCWPESILSNSKDGKHSGLKCIAGTDPLPVVAETGRVGSFGFSTVADWDTERPAYSMRRLLKNESLETRLFGSSQAVLQFVSRQIAIRR